MAMRFTPRDRRSLWANFGYISTALEGELDPQHDAAVSHELRECAARMRPVLTHLNAFMEREGLLLEGLKNPR